VKECDVELLGICKGERIKITDREQASRTLCLP
jgi:hypothetical protein